MTTETKQTLTIYMRPAPRLPKLIALAAIYWRWMEHIKNGAIEIVLKPLFEGAHPPMKKMEDGRTWEYHLDCCGNGYRERGMKSELEVVMHDFEMADAKIEVEMLVEIAQAHNVRANSVDRWTSRNIMNKAWGSLGFLSGSAWPLISEVTAGSWIWGSDVKMDAEGNLICDSDGRPILVERATRESLSQSDFIRMTIEVILEALEADYAKKNKMVDIRSWHEASGSKVINDLLGTRFQGKPLSAGNVEFPTLSGYIRNLWTNGKTVSEIRTKLRPWMRLWRIIEQTLEEAKKIQPHHRFGVCLENRRGVAFDFSVAENTEGMDNPLVHKGQLAEASLVIVRKADGHTGIFGRGFTDESMQSLARTLDAYEPGLWFYEGGSGIYNGSNSRSEIRPSHIPIYVEKGNCLIRLAQNYLRCAPAPIWQKHKTARRS